MDILPTQVILLFGTTYKLNMKKHEININDNNSKFKESKHKSKADEIDQDIFLHAA